MFCYQRSFGSPTEVVTQEQFRALVGAPRTFQLVKEAREALAQGDKKTYDAKKKSLPFVIFIATYDESEKEVKDKKTGEKSIKKGRWRNQKTCRLNGLCVIDYDHVDETTEADQTTPPSGHPSRSACRLLPEGRKNSGGERLREIWDAAYGKLSEEDKKRILLVYITPSGHGLKVVFMADANVGNLIDNQKDFSAKLGLNPDEACKDASRGAFLTTSDDILLIDEEKLITYENEEFGKKYNEQYHNGMSQPTIDSNKNSADSRHVAAVEGAGKDQPSVSAGDGDHPRAAESLTYNGVTYAKIIEAWMEGRDITNNRHNTLVELANQLRYLVGKNAKKIEEVVMQLPWVQDLAAEGENVSSTIASVIEFKYREYMPKKMKEALEKVGALKAADQITPGPSYTGGEKDTSAHPGDTDIYGQLPLDQWAEELQEMAEYYPCLKELFLNVHPHKLPAVWFSSAAMFGTLMTRAWYHFWYEPELVRRLNYCIFIIGDPGAGKNIVEKFYKKIADPMIQADQCLIDAVNRYKEGRTERSTSTKAQKGEALKRPVVGIRVHPARTATGEFIRHMNAAVETIQGQPLNLHMFSFDAELDNVTKQNKGGDWKDREILELKSFHNEEDGQMYANQESVTGMFNVYWNFIYTGTPYALHRKVNQRNFGTGMSTRLAVIPLPDKGMAQRHQQVDPDANEALHTWAYRLDKVEGEIPIEPLNDETYDWQTTHLEIAEFNGDKADRSLLKRIPYYGIGVSLPFILMRHWDEWQEHRTLTMDDNDKRLCRLAMEIQYKCQQFFFGEMAFNYFADQNKEFVVRRRSTRYSECYRKLPDEFKTQQLMDCFGVSQPTASRAIERFKKDGIIENVKYGVYRKVVQELL